MDSIAPAPPSPVGWRRLILPWRTTVLVTLVGLASGALVLFLRHGSWDRAIYVEWFLVFTFWMFFGQWLLRVLDRRSRRPPAVPGP